ncbi:hypothetical protein L6164_023375 [Bauhinia variegata]|uniref:Uncharacterized protein n=1 Tax=Bauhinia variegata TaxID=167791 RepID=A0ACB9MIG0_BAUVA|nr:hypothetical protein L6164_023375 [Bauhinia variegata]
MADSPVGDGSTKSLNIDDLPDEILEKIFRRLECPSAVRCMSVSKRWYNLISSPHFICGLISHHHRHSQVQKQLDSQVLLFSPEESQFNSKAPTSEAEQIIFLKQLDSSVPFTIENTLINPKAASEAEPIVRKFLLGLLKDYRVLGESNGWLCCTKHHGPANVYYICNPLTKHWLQLPPAPSWSRILSLGFLCDPCYQINEETHAVALNYKCRFGIVRILRVSYGLKRVEVFSSSTGRWSETESSFSNSEWYPFKEHAVAFDGKLHFLGRRILSIDPFENIETCITSKSNFIGLPEVVNPLDLLITSSGSLGIVDQIHGEVKIWELKDHKEGTWSLEERKDAQKIAVNLRQVDPTSPTHDIFAMLNSITATHSRIVLFHYDDILASYKLHVKLDVDNIGFAEPCSRYLCIKVSPMVLPWWPGPALNYPRNPSS